MGYVTPYRPYYLSLQTHAFFVNFLIGGCGLGAYKWRAYFPAFISGFYYKKQEKIALNLQAYGLTSESVYL